MLTKILTAESLRQNLQHCFRADAEQIRATRSGPGGPGGPGVGGPGPGGAGFGGPGGPGFDGPGNFGGRGRGMRRPGEILPPFLQDQLQLSEAQRSEIATLQSEVDARLKKILSEEQLQRMAQPPGPPQGAGPGNPGPGGPPVGGGRNGNRPLQE